LGINPSEYRQQQRQAQVQRGKTLEVTAQEWIASNQGKWAYSDAVTITHDPDSLSPEEVKEEYSQRWKVEVFYRELKQTPGVANCRCRQAQIWLRHASLSAQSHWLGVVGQAKGICECL